MPKSVRRVVTGHDAAGRSTFIIDAPTPHVFSRSKGSAIVHELWETAGTPADNRGNADAIARGPLPAAWRWHCPGPPPAAAQQRLGVPGYRISARLRAPRRDRP